MIVCGASIGTLVLKVYPRIDPVVQSHPSNQFLLHYQNLYENLNRLSKINKSLESIFNMENPQVASKIKLLSKFALFKRKS